MRYHFRVNNLPAIERRSVFRAASLARHLLPVFSCFLAFRASLLLRPIAPLPCGNVCSRLVDFQDPQKIAVLLNENVVPSNLVGAPERDQFVH